MHRNACDLADSYRLIVWRTGRVLVLASFCSIRTGLGSPHRAVFEPKATPESQPRCSRQWRHCAPVPFQNCSVATSLSSSAPVNILYLENHQVFADQVIRQFLSAHRVTVVPSLSAARSAFASGTFDLVLSDYDLDDGKGDEFVRECRAARPRLPVIAASSH